ncbi:MAG: hypothetical protein CVV49_04185 [Spirochaetae bacterium HGW-Spirochaetae-5]|nr:MAG: hypothetical protein CVV49_04185 [Spirochaetae bacterium HGW-Spirochaetae-5]
MNKQKIYISTFEIENKGSVQIPFAAKKFIEELQKNNFELFIPLKWREYPIIEKEIDECNALIALVDKYWASSTWKASEVTYAACGVGAFFKNELFTPKPTFIYFLEKIEPCGYMDSIDSLIYLPDDFNEACNVIKNTLNL